MPVFPAISSFPAGNLLGVGGSATQLPGILLVGNNVFTKNAVVKVNQLLPVTNVTKALRYINITINLTSTMIS